MKDLRRAWRNPVGWLVFLALPLLITALPGPGVQPALQSDRFGKGASSLWSMRMKTAPDKNVAGGRKPRDGQGNPWSSIFVARDQGLVLLNRKKVSAMLVIPAGFTRDYLSGTNTVFSGADQKPCRIHLSGVDRRNSLLRWWRDSMGLNENFGDGLARKSKGCSVEKTDYKVASQLVRPHWGSDKREPRFPGAAAGFLYCGPGFSHFQLRGASGASGSKGNVRQRPNIFGYMLPGMAAMFLLFIAESSSRDIQREIRPSIPSSALGLCISGFTHW